MDAMNRDEEFTIGCNQTEFEPEEYFGGINPGEITHLSLIVGLFTTDHMISR
jgi:hypothetical protein